MRHFCAVVETTHLRKAAEMLGVTPGALSKSLARFQEQLQIRLFSTEGKSLVLTKEGRNFYNQIKRILADIDDLQTVSRIDEKNSVIIGSFEVFTTFLFAEIVDDIKSKSTVKLLEFTPGKMEEALVEGGIDFGVSYIPVPNPAIAVDKICDFSFGIFCVERWCETPLSEVSFAVPVTSVPQNPLMAYDLDTWPMGHPRNVQFHFELLQTALLGASKGNNVIFCPRFVVKLYNRYLQKPFQLVEHSSRVPFKTKQSVFLMRKKDRVEDLMCKKIAKHLRMLCKD
ncbi:MAG: LysR family transcriptional regulator [Pseudobdellovibrionaceae bacterium]